MNADDREALALLRWYVEMEADEAIGFEAEDRLAPASASMPLPAPILGQSARPVPAASPPVHPKVLVLSGGTAADALLAQSQSITRLRGRWLGLALPGLHQPVPTLPMFHPSFLLRTPERNRDAWRDLLSL